MRKIDQLLNVIGWNKSELAHRLGRNLRTVQRWASGQNETPREVLQWLERLAAAHEDNPAPVGWLMMREGEVK
jgi:ribosome-binding protein aMBF1 (putative translation factor)